MSRYSSKMMNKEEIFSTWAPEASLWSRWAKPVLFAYLDSALSRIPITEAAGDVSWSQSPNEKIALVLNLPGAEGILAGVALGREDIVPSRSTMPCHCCLANPSSIHSLTER